MAESTAAPRFDGVIVVAEGADEAVGGLALVERAAFGMTRAGARRLLFVGPRPARRLRLPEVPIAWNEDPTVWSHTAASIVVVTSATTVATPDALAALVAADATGALAVAPPAMLWRAPLPHVASRLAHGLAVPIEARAWTPPDGALVCAADSAGGRARAEARLYTRLGRSGDGWFTRVVDRRFSRALTRLLLPTGVSPNQVTVGSIAIGIAGGLCFALGTPAAAIAGALLFLFSTIVDGCDGEIARLTFRESRLGARLDILGDNLVHLFLFGGIAGGLYRRSGDPVVAILGWVLLVGVLLAMATVYVAIIRRTPNAAQQAFFEAFASREFAYLLVVLTLAGRLDWFLWMSALGTYAFAFGLVLLGRRSIS